MEVPGGRGVPGPTAGLGRKAGVVTGIPADSS